MTITFTPASDTIVKTEFAGTAQTVSVNVSQTLEFEIKTLNGLALGTVVYSHPYDYTFSDMVIAIAANGKSFTATSLYNYAVQRTTHYLIQDEPTAAAKQYFSVSSPHLLPENYKGIYRVESPEDLITVTFTVTGRERTITPALVYGPWYIKTYQWTLDVQSSFSYTATAIKLAIKQGQGYKKAILTRPEAVLP